MRIYFLTNQTASKVWRLHAQARYMASLGHEIRIEDFGLDAQRPFNPANLDWADVIVSEMVFDSRIIEAIAGTNKKLIYEIDDLQEWTHKEHYAYDITKAISYKSWKRRFDIWKFMRHADAFIVTNEKLKNTYKWLKWFGRSKKIYVLPNYVDMEYFHPGNIKPTVNETGRIRILWAGGSSHDIDLRFIRPVLRKILEKYDNVDFVCFGHGGWSSPTSPFVEFQYSGDKSHVFKGLPRERIHYMMWKKWHDYPRGLWMTRCDFGIAPLVQNKFAEMKTPIKAMEYGVIGLPTVGARFLYKDVIIDGETGFLAETQDEFFEAMCKLIEDKELREKMGKAAQKRVLENFNINDHVHKWAQVFEDVYRKR